MKNILVYLGATSPADPVYSEAVKELGEKLAHNGMTLIFGGSKEGTMAVLADAVLTHGGKAVGIFTKALPMRFLYPGLTETVITETLSERKQTMLSRADGIIAMPGSFGTLDELFDALEIAKIEMIHHRQPKPIAVLNLKGYYDPLLAFIRHSIDVGFTTPAYAGLLKSAASVDELLELMN